MSPADFLQRRNHSRPARVHGTAHAAAYIISQHPQRCQTCECGMCAGFGVAYVCWSVFLAWLP
eukprot:gene4136-70_t